jgi:hypothetical protein
MVDVPFFFTENGEQGRITFDEAKWAYNEVITPLNREVARAAARYRWKLIGGVAEKFRTHGYCSSDPWIVQLTASLWKQGGVPQLAKRKLPRAFWWVDAPLAHTGALHPNNQGHRQIALLVTDALKKNGIDGQLED